MSFKIGFAAQSDENKETENVYAEPQRTTAPRRSVVQVYFPGRHMTLAYYNDQFDLYAGDLVYVDGKLEGLIGRVADVNYNFKIKISDYKRVIAVVDTTVHGQFFITGSHLVTFDREALPFSKAVLWFKAPANEDDEFVSGNDDTVFDLDDLSGMNVTSDAAQCGHDYYLDNKVRYISVDNGKGYAVVEGRECYEVEFKYHNGEISQLVCSCFCSCNCKHEFAAMLQLRETLELIEKNYAGEHERTGYFAAVNKGTFFSFAVDGKQSGTLTL